MSCRGLVCFTWPAQKEGFMELKMVSHKDWVQFCLLVHPCSAENRRGTLSDHLH